jgi:glycine/D-amino acid oxidase-like deaminating enzyme
LTPPADVVVVGAGIAGLSAAYELAQNGKSVIVLDRGPLGGGMTARTSGHLASEFDDFYHEHIRLRGLQEARSYYISQSAAISRVEEIQKSEGIDCDFRRIDGFLFAAPGTDPKLLERELDACREIGIQEVAWSERAPVPGVDTGRALRFADQARFHPLKYLDGLVRCIQRDGGRVFAGTPVVHVEEKDGEVTVETTSGHIRRSAIRLRRPSPPASPQRAIGCATPTSSADRPLLHRRQRAILKQRLWLSAG